MRSAAALPYARRPDTAEDSGVLSSEIQVRQWADKFGSSHVGGANVQSYCDGRSLSKPCARHVLSYRDFCTNAIT